MTAGGTRVTVLMAVHNAGPYLAEALDSLARQTLKDFEILAIDDGSTDDSAAILRACRDPRLRVVTRANRGFTATLNEGLERCATPLVARMDPDDRCHPERLERQLSALAADPALVLVGSCASVIDPGGKQIGTLRTVEHDAAIRRVLAVMNCFVHGSVMYRTEAARAAGGYRDAARPAADYDFFARVVALGRVANLPETLYEWRSHPASVSRSRPAAQRIATERIAGELWARFGEAGPAPRSAWPEIWTESLDHGLGASLHLEFACGYLRRGARGLALQHVLAALALRPRSGGAWGSLPAMLLPAPWFAALEFRARLLQRRMQGW